MRHARIRRRRKTRGRLDRNRFDGLPLAKRMRVVDEAVLQAAKDRGQCEVCMRPAVTVGHHVKSQGSGGDDTRANLAIVCSECHAKIHMGLISRDRLRQIIERRAIPLGAA